jgi:iron-regulated transporter 1
MPLTLFFQVLSFDGTMITFLKNTQPYSDPFIAGQRAACTVAGLSGTLLFPLISRKIGLVRTGSWAIWQVFWPLQCLTDSDP